MKKTLFVSLFLLTALCGSAKVKYVFYFIGDGMGVNQVNVTETYLAALQGQIGYTPLTMTSLPVVGLVNTYSATNGVTDSAAGGTALATGKKTKNGVIGMLKDQTTPVYSIAQWAHDNGAAVGIGSSCSVDHATPAAFYAHAADRNEYYNIGKQLTETDFDFFGGPDFRKNNEHPEEGTLHERAQKAGYTIAKGYKDYQKKSKKAQKMLLIQSDEANERYGHEELPYALDLGKNDLDVEQITRAGIHFLMQKQGEKDGFFLMIEGGKIDYCCHRNDIGSMVHETVNFDNAIKVAYEFYQQHPDETAIVISADHETGGLVMGTGAYTLYTDLLRYQRMSIPYFQTYMNDLYKKAPAKFDWTLVERELKAQFGFWEGIQLSDAQTQRLKNRYAEIEKAADDKKATAINNLGSTCNHIMSEVAHISWASGGHSNGFVPIFAIGEGTEVFQGRVDNIEIAPALAEIAGYKHE